MPKSVTDWAIVVFLGVLALSVVESWIGRLRMYLQKRSVEQLYSRVKPFLDGMHKDGQQVDQRLIEMHHRINRLEGNKIIPLHPGDGPGGVSPS